VLPDPGLAPGATDMPSANADSLNLSTSIDAL
jgi:hypothetical protein